MPIGEICNREVVVARRDSSIMEAAQLMRQHHVGDLVVIEERNGLRVPVGIVTDRDLVVEIMAPGVDHTEIALGDIMPTELATVVESAGIFETIEYMRARGVRRLPVLDKNGGLAGIVALDDILELLAEELLSLAKLVRHEQNKEMKNRR
jgi:predicted transcriptional regulator